MEGQAAAAAAAISAVLDDDDLLVEILLRVVFPTSLVRAVLVCKRWLRLASAPGFLRHFRDLHPPRLLGFYVMTHSKSPRFVPIPQPPELASVVPRASFDLDTMGSDRLYVDCSNGLLLVTFRGYSGGDAIDTTRVRCPLYLARYLAILPPLPDTTIHDGFRYYCCEILPNGFCLVTGCKEQQTAFDVYVLQDSTSWAIYSSVVCELSQLLLEFPSSLIAHGKIYNLALVSSSYKLVSLDLSSSSLSVVNLPEEVKSRHTVLSLAKDSGVHLIHLKGSQLRTWLYTVDNNGLANWLLANTICLHEMCANHMIPTTMFEAGDSHLLVHAVGVNSGLFLEKDDAVLYLFDIKRKTVEKVFEVTPEERYLYIVRPFMMVWPPKFPVMTEEGVIQKNDVLQGSQNNCIKCHNRSS